MGSSRYLRLPAVAIALMLLAPAAAASDPRLVRSRPVWAGESPLSSCVADDAPSQVGIVYEGSQVEPHVAVHPTEPGRVVAAWQQDRWSNGAARGIVVATSDDAGESWRTVTETKTSACTGGTESNGGGFDRTTDPWLSFAADGSVYLAALSVDRDGGDGPFGVDTDAILVSRSHDAGASWSDPVTLTLDRSAMVHNDKPSITAHPTDPSIAYAVWAHLESIEGEVYGATWFSRTTDAGATWEPARPIFHAGGSAHPVGDQIVVLPDGTLINAFTLVSLGPTTSYRAAAVRSTDGGLTWSPPVTIDDMRPAGTADPLTGERIKTGEKLIDVAVDERSGAVFAAWSDGRFSNGVHNDVALAASGDAGASWSEPVRANLTPGSVAVRNRQAFTPSVHVTERGVLGVSYYDLRRNGSDVHSEDPLETDRFLSYCGTYDVSQPGLCTERGGWEELRLTGRSFDLRQAPRTGGLFVGDYMGLAGSGAGFTSVFVAEAGDAPARARVAQVKPMRVGDRAVWLRLRRHLVAKGRVVAADERRCAAGATVIVQRKSRAGWKRIAVVGTDDDGRFRSRLRDRTGRYRARLRSVVRGDVLCAAARSPARLHRHG